MSLPRETKAPIPPIAWICDAVTPDEIPVPIYSILVVSVNANSALARFVGAADPVLRLILIVFANTFVGSFAGRKLTTGSYNIAIGSEALSFGVITGNHNVAIGNVAGYSTTTTANNNCYLGYAAGYKVTTGTQNTIIGAEAGMGDLITSTVFNTTGSNNTLIGYRAVPSTNIISNEITLGNSSVNTLRCAAALTTLSDSRDKKDVLPLAYGLDFLTLLRPVSFTWDCRDGSRAGQTSSGFIAQEVKAAQESIVGATEALHLVYEANPEQLEMTAGNLLPVLVKAIQELSIRIKALEAIQNG